MSMTVTAIDHVQITCTKAAEDACKRFYGEILGLEEIEKPDVLKPRGGAWYQVGALQVHLGVEPEAEGGGGTGAGSKRHVAFLVQDLEAAKAALSAAGCTVEPEATEPGGLRRIFTRDPAGNKVEIAVRG